MFDLSPPLFRPSNEPVFTYVPNSPERGELKKRLKMMEEECIEIPHQIGGRSYMEGDPFQVTMPHRHRHVLATCRHAPSSIVHLAIESAKRAFHDWSNMSFEARARIFLRAADLLSGPWRSTLNAATMLGQGKTAIQSELDAACELIDFFRFNAHFCSRLAESPHSPSGVRNVLEMRPLEGFVLAISPFNFTAIAGNLPTAPAMFGNVVVWKPAEDQSLAAHYTMQLLEAAGLPPGVINVVYGAGAPVADACLAHPDLAGVHFTGSTQVFQRLWQNVGERIATYRSYPRLVGETGGKGFIFAHPSANVSALSAALVRGAFEFSGQKCSAASRAYVPRSIWPKLKSLLLDMHASISVGEPTDFRHFTGAVINRRAYDRLDLWRQKLKADNTCQVFAEKPWSSQEGYFAGPMMIEVKDPAHALMQTELFGPILAFYIYEDHKEDEVLALIDETSPYGLTGAIFSEDRAAITRAVVRLQHAAGNLYLNDKPTGAVVGQQPFGGARGSGTNDKAGSSYNLLRWASPRTIKEVFVSPEEISYPFMKEA